MRNLLLQMTSLWAILIVLHLSGVDGGPVYVTSENLLHLNDGRGKNGICQKVFRILDRPESDLREYCADYYNSDLGRLEDLAGLYNSIVSSNHSDQTQWSIYMDDRLGKYWIKFDIYVTDQIFLSPELITSPVSQHILCVQKIACQQSTTTSTTSTTTTTETPLPSLVTKTDNSEYGIIFSTVDSDSFWRMVFEKTDPKSWVVSTILLSIFSLILFIALIMVSICFCRIKSAHIKEKCYGACKYGCRCDPDIIRQVSRDAKFVRSLSSAATPISARINGGTLRSNGNGTYQPLGRNWEKPSNQLFVSLTGDEHSPNGILSHCMNGNSTTLTRNPNWNSNKRTRRMSQEAIQRSISEGSSVSGHTAPPNLLGQKNSLIQNTTSKLMNFMQNGAGRASSPNHFYQPTTYLGSNFINGPYMTHGSPNGKANGVLSRKEGRYFMKGNIDEVDEDNEHIGHHMTMSNMSETRASTRNNELTNKNGKDLSGDNETDPMNISPPLGFFDQSQTGENFSNGGIQFSGMMGSTGSFLSNGPTKNGAKHTLLANGWSNCSSPHNNNNNNNDMPSLPPRDVNNCSDESNDSGKSSGHPSAGTSNGLPKLSGIFHECGPPIVSQAPSIFLNRTSNYTST